EELVEQVQAIAPTDVSGMQRHVEETTALVLRGKLRPPVAKQDIRVLQPRSLARKQHEELIIEMIVIWHRDNRPRRGEIRDAIMRGIVRRAIPQVAVTLIDQKLRRVRTDRS